jgi:phosphatidylserine/phosphatidylglycerophosphate/cardiolipin synthase-like enzyme
MRKNRSPKKAPKRQFSFQILISSILLSLGAGYNIPYYYAAHYELPTLIQENSQELAVCFSPNPLCQQTLLTTLKMSRYSIRLQGYGFTDPKIAEVLIEAKRRGVDVQLILDKSNKTDKHSQAKVVAQYNIPVYIDSPRGIAHNKVILIDDDTIITGSYNWTTSAHRRNAENLLILKNQELAQRYHQNWIYRKELSHPFMKSADAVLIDKSIVTANPVLSR